MWGTDLSGTRQGAGGVGGLLAISGTNSQFTCFDGDGNITALVDTTSSAVTGQYEYGPFGETIRVTGSASGNPFRFSTKCTDAETDFLYYGYRFYNLSTGRWLSRDPIEDLASTASQFSRASRIRDDPTEVTSKLNEYAFVLNSPIQQFDFLGLTLIFENESCQDFNAGFVSFVPGSSSIGTLSFGSRIDPTWKPGGSGSISHAGVNLWPFTGMCNTETHIQIRARNDSQSCTKYRITCSWLYFGIAKGTVRSQINIKATFLGNTIYRYTDDKPSRPKQLGPYESFGMTAGYITSIVNVPYGKTIDVFHLSPYNVVESTETTPDAIVEHGEVNCTAVPLDGP
jgi:RHS repeat-associated protein